MTIICPRCGRQAVGWPVYRGGDRCSPEGWADCIREPDAILSHLARCSDPFCKACLATIAAQEAS